MDNSDTNDLELDARAEPVADRRSFIKRMAMVAGATTVVPAIASFALGSSAKPKSVAFAQDSGSNVHGGGNTNGGSNTTTPPVVVRPSTTTTMPPATTTTLAPTTTLPPTTTTTDTAGSGGAELPPTK